MHIRSLRVGKSRLSGKDWSLNLIRMGRMSLDCQLSKHVYHTRCKCSKMLKVASKIKNWVNIRLMVDVTVWPFSKEKREVT